MSTDLHTIIDELLPLADPEGPNHARLLRLQGRVRDRVMLSAGDLRFLQDLITMRDNIACDHMTEAGYCTLERRACDHHDRYRTCGQYDPSRGHGRHERSSP